MLSNDVKASIVFAIANGIIAGIIIVLILKLIQW